MDPTWCRDGHDKKEQGGKGAMWEGERVGPRLSGESALTHVSREPSDARERETERKFLVVLE